MTKRELRQLRARVRANCCPIHGLGAGGLEQHVDAIVHMVEIARARTARDEFAEAQARDRRQTRDQRRRVKATS